VGLGKDAVSGQIADLLPKMIDKLTPDGKLPQGDLIEQGLNMLKKSFLGK
jgi:uncharacterized protein YidB (DUF937 family)